MEKIEDMSAGEAEEHIAALYGDELYGLELDGEVSGGGAMRCACSPVHDEVRGICDMLGLDFTRVDRIATERAGMLWAGEGMPHRFDACFEIRDIARRLRALRPDGTVHIEQQVANMRYDLTTGQVETVVPGAGATNLVFGADGRQHVELTTGNIRRNLGRPGFDTLL